MKVGRKIANEVCEIAAEWGNVSASGWKHDLEYIRYLGVTAVNKGASFDVGLGEGH
jgi:hypothetical protein